jgi:hypothetical protein
MTEAQREYQREWRKRNPTYARDWMRQWRANPENKAKERMRPWYSASEKRICGVRIRSVRPA